MNTPHSRAADQPLSNPKVEQGALGRSATHTVVADETPLRLPHERDESSDSGTRAPSRKMLMAAAEAEDGRADAPRGPQTQLHYSELTEQAQADGDPQGGGDAQAPKPAAQAPAGGPHRPADTRKP